MRPPRFRLLLAVAMVLVGLGSCASLRVVTAVVPYTPILSMDTANHALGTTGCDLNGQPIIYINPRVRISYVPWVLLHERIHVEQLRAHSGGCAGYAEDYSTNETFRLHAEAEAFCGVYATQILSGMAPVPDLNAIVVLLTMPARVGYRGHWTAADAQAAMSCWHA